MRVKQPPVITTDQWGARPPKEPVHPAGRPHQIIFHHTAGHHPEIATPGSESRLEAFRYARAIQKFHMDVRGWNDSGHNFLVCRNGLILVGRHQSYNAIREGHMVWSDHCPGQNDQPGIEHEHNGNERMTPAQFESSARLHAWIIDRCGMDGTPIHPHREFFNTDCPGVLMDELHAFKARVEHILTRGL